MIHKIHIFLILLLGLGQMIKYNIITSIPKQIYDEFSIVFYFTFFMYIIVEKLLNEYSTTFKNINPEHKKSYVVKNYIKSFFLAGLCFGIPQCFELLNGTLDLIFIKRCCIYYIMNDILGLLIVQKLPTTTKIHHLTTSSCGLAIMMKTSTHLDILTLIVLYAIFSSIAFCVNFYLGLRVYSTNIKLKKFLSITSFWIYFISCMISWVFQAFMAYIIIPNVPLWHTILYFIFLFSVGRDDIILMKWLFDDNKQFNNIL
jgi:hypothetical protein